MTSLELTTFVKKLPMAPGVYLFQNAGGQNIYIGKASSLRARVRSYRDAADPRIRKMVAAAAGLKFIRTDSEIEALILESNLIKQKQPQFNIMLRDDKQYFYVGFTKEEFPRIILTHQPHDPTVAYIGPFTEGTPLKAALRFLRTIFPYCTCTQRHHNFCLNYHIGKCLGYCCLREDSRYMDPEQRPRALEHYAANIRAIKEILEGKKSTLIKSLMKEMDRLARNDKMEDAIMLRNKIARLEHIFEHARIVKNSEILRRHEPFLARILKTGKTIRRIEGYDISNIHGQHAVGVMVMFRDGAADKNFYRLFNIKTVRGANDTAMLSEVLQRRLNHEEWPFPDLMVVDGGKGQTNAARATLAALGIQIPVIGLVKDARHSGRAIIVPGRTQPVPLSKLSPADRNLLLAVDGEAHRFAIGHYRRTHRRQL
ncbi:MAG TPA: GIY-YIG nuclease family protein [Candidatus Paceibacterota bacterium]|nr:GIY-YIG nuclease family protein [Candidatus Paceibacterota bacterium]